MMYDSTNIINKCPS